MKFKQFIEWLLKPVYLWVLVLGLFVSLLIGSLLDFLLLSALILQFLAVVCILISYYQTDKTFKSKRLSLIKWLKNFPFFNNNTTTKSVDLRSTITLKTTIDYTMKLNPKDDTLEARIDALEKNLDIQIERVGKVKKEFETEIANEKSAREKLRDGMDRKNKEFENIIQNLAVGNIDFQLLGAYWTTASIIILILQIILI